MPDEPGPALDAADGAPEGTPHASAPADASPAEEVSSEEDPGERPNPGKILRGAVVAPGLALGVAHRKDVDLAEAMGERVPLDRVDRELNRFRKSLDDSRLQILDLKSRLAGKVPDDDARILDTHVTYLKDSVFIADVENLILQEQMRLEAAIGKVVGDFDRIFRLVENEALRQSAVDLRDVGIRVLRNLERDVDGPGPSSAPTEYVLIARTLSIVDMFNLSNEHVKGIVTQEGGLTSHAAIFARSMRIPTITGVEGVLDEVEEGAFVILDAAEGLLRVNPSEKVRAQYTPELGDQGSESREVVEVPDWARRPARTLDGEKITIGSSCGNLPEVERGTGLGVAAVGLYRTELLYLVGHEPPSRDALVQHYASVVGAARGAPVTFRLLNVDSSVEIPYLHARREANPALGKMGIRALLDKESILRRQLQAILLASKGCELHIAIPFVSDCGELRRVKEILFEERFELRKAKESFQDTAAVGVVLETPASILGVRELAMEADFLMVNLDSLQQYLLATDRESPELSSTFEVLHPFVLRALLDVVEAARAQGRPLWVFGITSRRLENLPLLIGAGLHEFCVPPSELRRFLDAVCAIESKGAARRTRSAAQSACRAEMGSLISGYRHGYAP